MNVCEFYLPIPDTTLGSHRNSFFHKKYDKTKVESDHPRFSLNSKSYKIQILYKDLSEAFFGKSLDKKRYVL